MLIAGIDEAGKGPVIGPIVVCLFFIDEKDAFKLKAIGVKDSKQLTPWQREKKFEELKDAGKWLLKIISAQEIDARSGSFNQFECGKMADLINEGPAEVGHVYIDSIEADGKRFASKLKALLKRHVAITAEPKGDVKFPVCSAASIIAKVTRDREVAALRERYGDFGSGYPSDPKTIAFLEEWARKNEFPPVIVRKTWSTTDRLFGKEKQKKLGQFD